MVDKNEIRDHIEVVDNSGSHVGTVDHMQGEDQIKLTKSDPASGGMHHFIPLSWVDRVESDKVILSKNKAEVTASW